MNKNNNIVYIRDFLERQDYLKLRNMVSEIDRQIENAYRVGVAFDPPAIQLFEISGSDLRLINADME